MASSDDIRPVELEAKCNSYVTKICNNKHLPNTKKQFLNRCVEINLLLRRGFSSRDFPEITPNCFRQRIHRLNDIIEIHVKSSVCYYRVKGVPVGNDISVTDNPMGEKMIWLLHQAKKQPAAIHNIKIQFSSTLYGILSLNSKYDVNPSNKSIVIEYRDLMPGYLVKLLVYPSLIQIDIACTYNPIVYNIQGSIILISLLAKLHEHLLSLDRFQYDIPDFRDWIITHYHFGWDGTDEYNAPFFHITIGEAAEGLIRYYTKSMLDGRVIARCEQARTPKISIAEELEKMFQQENSQEFTN